MRECVLLHFRFSHLNVVGQGESVTGKKSYLNILIIKIDNVRDHFVVFAHN